MKTPENQSEQTSAKKGSFEKVGECLYRYTPNGTYYARVEKEGKEFRRSLKTTDRAVARRKLADFQREVGRTLPGANRITVAQLADKYLATQQHLEKNSARTKAGSCAGLGSRGRGAAVSQSTRCAHRTWRAGFRPREPTAAPAASTATSRWCVGSLRWP